MEEKKILPPGFCEVTLQLDCEIISDKDKFSLPIYSHKITRQMDFSDYISLMRKLKTMAFVPFGNGTINKMHIVSVESTLSPHIVMSVGGFIHEQKISAFDLGKKREELYNEWCEGLSERYEQNEALSSNKK